jgi:hypothetical protein
MAKVIKKTVVMIDAQGYEWVSGDFTESQILAWLKRYKVQGVYLSVRAANKAAVAA